MVQIIWEVRISKGQIIWAILYNHPFTDPDGTLQIIWAILYNHPCTDPDGTLQIIWAILYNHPFTDPDGTLQIIRAVLYVEIEGNLQIQTQTRHARTQSRATDTLDD